MAYTFGYGVIEAVTAYLNGDEVNDEEKEILINLAACIEEDAKYDFVRPSLGDEDEYANA